MPARKTKAAKLVSEKVEEPKTEVSPVTENSPMVETSPVVETPTVAETPSVSEEPVVAEPPVIVETSEVEPGNLARQIDSLNKIVENDPSTETKQGISTEQTEVNKTKPKFGWVKTLVAFFAGLLLGIGVGFVVWGWLPNLAKNSNITPQEIVEKPKETPTPTVGVVNLDKTKIKVSVLNGTGGKGVAAKAKEILTTAGYIQVTTGNAQESDYTKTKISIKDSKSDYLEGLKTALKNDYVLDDKIESLAESEEWDVVVIVGSE